MGFLPQLSSAWNCLFAECEQNNETIKQLGFVLHTMETLIPSWERISVRGEAAISISNQAGQAEEQAASPRRALHPGLYTAQPSHLLTGEGLRAAPLNAGEAGVLELSLVELKWVKPALSVCTENILPTNRTSRTFHILFFYLPALTVLNLTKIVVKYILSEKWIKKAGIWKTRPTRKSKDVTRGVYNKCFEKHWVRLSG